MIRCYSRGLNLTERSSLEKDAAYAQARQKKWKLLCWWSVPIALAIGTPLALWQAGKDPALGYLAFASVATYLGIIGWVYRSNTKDERHRLKANLWALSADRTHVIHCQCKQVNQLEVIDLPSLFFFQVRTGTLLFCEMYPEELREKQFPNSDFEVVKVYGPRGELLLLELRCSGEKLTPLNRFEGQQAKDTLQQVQLPLENFSLMDGRIDQLASAVPMPASQ